MYKDIEKRRAASKLWRLAHPKEANEYSARWKREHPDKTKEQKRKWRDNNREKALIGERRRLARWKKRHPEALKEQIKQQYLRYPERYKANKAKRRARELGAEGTFTATEIRNLYKQQQGLCAICKGCLNGKYHVDHIIPLVLGGSNKIENIQLTHGICNLRKGGRYPSGAGI